jgi:hypothetical protein
MPSCLQQSTLFSYWNCQKTSKHHAHKSQTAIYHITDTPRQLSTRQATTCGMLFFLLWILFGPFLMSLIYMTLKTQMWDVAMHNNEKWLDLNSCIVFVMWFLLPTLTKSIRKNISGLKCKVTRNSSIPMLSSSLQLPFSSTCLLWERILWAHPLSYHKHYILLSFSHAQY